MEFNTYYLDIPIHIGYKLPISQSIKLLGSVGSHVGVGLSGKSMDVTTIPQLQTKAILSDNIFKDKVQNHVDWVVDLNLGVEIQKYYQVTLGYHYGLKKITGKVDQLNKKNRVLELSFAYLF